MRVLVTGGAGFIGSAVCRHLVLSENATVLNIDKLTYASSLASLDPVKESDLYRFLQADITDAPAMAAAFAQFQPDLVMHLAAESHVDRSIDGADPFIFTNVVGSFVLLQAALVYWRGLEGAKKDGFRYLHVSTDEVYGSLGDTGHFHETTAYDPRSPYSASKAASDHLARAWHETYGLPVLISNCSNNYGPRQFPEKLIPLMILNALAGKPLPVYGDGLNVRDWIHVEDHARSLVAILMRGRVGETYLVGSRSERTNMQVVKALCAAFDVLRPEAGPHERLITFVADRPGHDRRYAIDPAKVERETGWTPHHGFEEALQETVAWYLANESWWGPIRSGVYQGQRLGLVAAG